MRTVSARFLAEIQRSHVAVVRVQLIQYDVNPANPVTITELDGVKGGAVTLDQGAAVRGKLALTLVDDGTMGLIPESASSPLTPYGNELRPYRGVRYADGLEELVSLGIYRMDSVDLDDTPAGVDITISAFDRAQRIVEARFEAPYQVAAGTNYVTAIQDVITGAYPDVVFDFPTTALVTPALLVQEEGADRWAFAQDMATSLGMRLFFDGDGICVLRAVSTGVIPDVTVSEGEDGVLVSASRGFRREGAYNRVIATGENTGTVAPVRGVATDSNPSSPTHYGGPYGNVPMFYSSPFLTTDDQAAGAASSLLVKQLGTTQSVAFGSIVNPALEPDDVALIQRALTGLDEPHIIDSLSIPLVVGGGDDALAATTRSIVAVL